MSHGHNRGRSSRQNYQSVDWREQFAAFERQPTWDEYFRLRRKIQDSIHRKNNRRYELLDKLDQMAMPLINQRGRVIPTSRAFQLEAGNKPLEEAWHNYKLRDFGLELIKYAWELSHRPGKQLWFKVLKQEDGSSERLGQAAELLQKGHVPPKMSRHDTRALLLWVCAKYFRQTEIISLAKQLRQALRDGNESEIKVLWQELALLLGPPERRFHKKERPVLPQATPSPRKEARQTTPLPKKEAPLATPLPQDEAPQATPSLKEVSQAASSPQEEAPQTTPAPQEAPQTTPAPQEAPQATPSVSKQAVSKTAPPARPSPEASPAVSEAAEEVLMAWQEAVGAFTSLVREQAAGVAQRDDFIKLLQHQVSNADDRTQQARDQAEMKVKRMLMQLLAEPLSQFQSTAALYEERDFILIYESFTQALARQGITPIGEMERQFTVSQDDLVRSIDGQPVVGQNVEQIGLGWQLQLSNGTVHPLVYPRVRRLNR